MNSLIFLGDYCVSDLVVARLSPSIEKLFRSAALICLNFEAPVISRYLQPTPKVGPTLCQSTAAIALCKKWGITHFSLANNHIMDYGNEGLAKTIGQLGETVCIGAGSSFEQAYRPCWFEAGGQRVALFSFAEAQFGVLQDEWGDQQVGYAWIDHPRARQAIRDAHTEADWVIVQVHAGLEMVDLPLPEWRLRYRELIDLGADLVVGHHPHVIQGSECYNGKMIHYSLGNFYMDVMLQQPDPGSCAALQVTIDEVGLQSEIIPLQVSSTKIDVDKTGKGQAHYQVLCDKLFDDTAYYVEVKKVCNNFWEETYSRYYESALLGLGTRPSLATVIQLLRRMAGCFLNGKKNFHDNELMLIHNIRIESHRWVVERALACRDRFQ